MPDEPFDIAAAFTRVSDLHKAQRWADALPLYFEYEPHARGDVNFVLHMGQCLAALGRAEEASDRLLLALALDPKSATAHSIMSAVQNSLGHHIAAGHHTRRGVELAPNMPIAHWHRALWLLKDGRYTEGWAEYEWGKVSKGRPFRHLQPELTRPCMEKGETLYVWAEQGQGDTFLMCRAIKALRERYPVCRIVFEVPPSLVTLLYGLPWADEVVACDSPTGLRTAFDEHISLWSIPHLLGWDAPYLGGSYIATSMSAELGGFDGMKVGVCWQGKQDNIALAHRSIEFEQFRVILDAPGCQFVSLQAGASIPDDTPLLRPELIDWATTAAIIEQLDLVITIDSAVANLAGAMGKPVWVLVPIDCDWRWNKQGERTPWYPSATIIRQTAWKDWSGPVAKVCRKLKCRQAVQEPEWY
jgi:hypothetical protein